MCGAGRYVSCDFLFGSVEWRVVCLYAPNLVNDRTDFFENIRQHLLTERSMAVLGDFNCVLSPRNKSSSTPFTDASTDLLAQVINESNLVDVEECLEGAWEVQYTHFQVNSHARLDRIYVALDLIGKCENYSVKPVSFSDHCLVQCSIGKKKQQSGFSWELWKLNAKLLQDELFAEAVKDRIGEIEDQNNLGEKWELCKQDIKLKAIERSSCIQYEQKSKEKALRLNLQKLIGLESRAPGVFKDDIQQIKQKLEMLDADRYRGALVRARTERLAAGETPTKRILGIEKAQSRRNQIIEIEWKGRLSAEKEDVERAFFEYYQSLFDA